jgi:hypothetical protein
VVVHANLHLTDNPDKPQPAVEAKVTMFKRMIEGLHVSKMDGLAKTFRRLGRIGFWLQVVLGSIPVTLMLYVFAISGKTSGPRAGLPIVEYLTIIGLLMLLFTTYWFHRYTVLSKAIADPQSGITESAVLAKVWIGLVASSLSLLFSMLVMLTEVGQLLFYFLAAPQGGIPAIQTTVGTAASWVSAFDMASLMALMLALTAEVAAMVLSLWLMFRTSQVSSEFPATAQE